jgi:integrase
MSNQNPFADPSLISFTELQQKIWANDELSYPRRREIASAINTVAAWFKLPLDMIPASTSFLRDRFKHVHPAHVNVSKRRIQNVRSLIMTAFRAEGITTKLAPYMTPMAPAWKTLWDMLEGSTYHRTELSRLFRYCSNQGNNPDELNDDISAAYLDALEAEALVTKPRTRHQSVCRVWNKCADLYHEKGWPKITLTVPRYEERLYSIGKELVSDGIKQDLDDYLNFLAGDDPFSAHAKPFKPKSLEAVKGHFWRYLSALHYQGVDLNKVWKLEELVTRDMFTLGMRWFWDRNENKTSKHIGEIAWSVRCYVVKHLGADEETTSFYADAMSRLRVNQQGLSDKNQAAMAQFDDPKAVESFVGLPPRLWDKAATMQKTACSNRITKKARLLVQASVAIEILTFAPMRISNLQGLRLDEHISWQAGRMRINIPRQQVKNDQALDFLLPESVSKRVMQYIDDWRPFLTTPANPYLFPGRNGKPKDSSALHNQIENTLWKEAGIRLTPHQFRHAAAKILLDAKPGHYEVVRKVLGHKSLTTTYSHYAGAETQAAISLYDDVIIQHRQKKAFADCRGRSVAEPPFMDPLQLYGGKR